MNLSDPNPTDRLERALQASLRPVDPGADFTAALVARLATEPATAAGAAMVPGQHQRRLHAASLALAASVMVALTVSWQLLDVRAAQRAEQSRIHSQLLLALEITSERLTVAQQRIEQFQTQENNL